MTTTGFGVDDPDQPNLIDKDADTKRAYNQDWTTYLNGAATIASSVWTADSGITIVSDSILSGNLKTQVILEGGIAGNEYNVANKITDSNGLTEKQNIIVRVVEKGKTT